MARFMAWSLAILVFAFTLATATAVQGREVECDEQISSGGSCSVVATVGGN